MPALRSCYHRVPRKKGQMKKQQWYVYFLSHGKKIVYVGMSCRIPSRVACHFNDKEFTSIRWIPCKSKFKATKYERRWIMKFMPKYNSDIHVTMKRREMGLIKKFIPKGSMETLKWIKQETGMSIEEILKNPLTESFYEYEKYKP